MSDLEDQLQRSGLQITGYCDLLSQHHPALLVRAPLLEDMTPDEADTLGRAMLLVRAAPGQTMIREGEFGDWMMLILKGTVDVSKQISRRSEESAEDLLAGLDRSETQSRNAPGEVSQGFPSQAEGAAPDASGDVAAIEPAPISSRVAVLRPGAAIGEMSMLDGGLRYTSCTAIGEVEAGVLGRRAIALLIRDHPTVGAKLLVKITQLMAQRLRNTGNHLVRVLRKQ